MMQVSKTQRIWQVVAILEKKTTHSVQSPCHMVAKSL